MMVLHAATRFLLAGLLLAGCGDAKGVPAGKKEGVLKEPGLSMESLRNLSRRTILFGHQSVGQNIVDGIEELGREGGPGTVSVVGFEGGAVAREEGAIYHVRIGKNRNPASKLDDFSRRVDEAASGGGLEVAFMKFCYVDIGPETDVEDLFRRYREYMGELKRKHGGTTFVHVTVPLTHVRDDWKAQLKRVVGKGGREREANVRRSAFNTLMLREYAGREPVFDLASLEATRPDGSRATFPYGGKRHDMLAGEYTDDDEHLDAAGRRMAANALLSFLSGHTE